MKKYLIFIVFTILLSCTSNNQYEPFIIKKEYIPLSLPQWILEIPSGNYEIGISQKMTSKQKELDNAKEFAAINYNRNIHSFVVNNKAVKKGEEIKDFRKFSVNISASIDKLHSIYNSMTLIDSIYMGNYFVALFSMYNEPKITFSKEMKSTFSQPDWHKSQNIYIENNKIYSTVKYSSATMNNAVNIAMEKARTNIASYKTKHVLSSTISTETNTSTNYAIETKMILGKVVTSNIYILKKKTNNALFSYEVYLRMWSSE